MFTPDLIGDVRARASLAAIVGRDVKLRRAGRELAGCCPFHRERTPSFHVDDAKGLYHCFGCGASGDAIDYLRQAHGLGFADAVRALADDAGLPVPIDGGVDGGLAARTDKPRLASPLPADPEQEADIARRRELALRIWAESAQPDGTPVEFYLASRGLALPVRPWRVLRYHPACPFGRDHMPAMVALVRNAETGEPQAIHRTPLTLAGDAPRGADGKKLPKQSLGMLGAGVVMLSPDSAVETGLAIAEGIETALHGFRRWSHMPVWSALSANGVAAFPVLRGIELISIYADNDASGAGMRAARQCASRWAKAGSWWEILMPNEAGKDFADLGKGSSEERGVQC